MAHKLTSLHPSSAKLLRQTSDMRTTVEPFNAWPSSLAMALLHHQQQPSQSEPPTSATLAFPSEPCTECHHTSTDDLCQQPDCEAHITNVCNENCVVVACTDPTHDADCQAVSSEPCPDGADCTALMNEILACCGGETHDWLASLKPGPWDPDLEAFLCECGFGPSHPVDKHPHVHHEHTGADGIHLHAGVFGNPQHLENGHLHHHGDTHHTSLPGEDLQPSSSSSTSPTLARPHFSVEQQRMSNSTIVMHNPSSVLPPSSSDPPSFTPSATGGDNFGFTTQATLFQPTSQALADSSQHPQPPTVAVYKCQWANCVRTFESASALVGHVNVDHLRIATETSMMNATNGPLGMFSPPLTPGLLSPQQRQLTRPDAPADLTCQWDNCGRDASRLVNNVPLTQNSSGAPPSSSGSGSSPPTLASVPPSSTSQLGSGHPGATQQQLVTHLLHDHLGVPVDLMNTWSRPTVKDLLAATPNWESSPRAQSSQTHALGQNQQGGHSTPCTPASLPPPSPSTSSPLVAPSSDASFTCNWVNCGATFPSLPELTSHLDTAHVGSGRAWYECHWTSCGRNGERGFGSRQKVRRHLQSHTGYRPFVCEVCGVGFSEVATLQQHMRRHTQHKPYVCDFPGCGKAFTVAGALTIHKRTHNGHKPFRCSYCDKAFAESSNLSKHLRTHTGSKPYVCVECNKAFARPDQLARHTAMHRRKNGGEGATVGGQ